MCHNTMVFPACAGMILLEDPGGFLIVRVPRMRGDDPGFGQIVRGAIRCSPHARG